MSDRVANHKTLIAAEEVLAHAAHFFSFGKFRITSQSARTITCEGRPPIPWAPILVTILGFAFCIIPGVIAYFLMVSQYNRFYSLAISARPIEGGTEVSVSYPFFAQNLVYQFLGSLPPLGLEPGNLTPPGPSPASVAPIGEDSIDNTAAPNQ